MPRATFATQDVAILDRLVSTDDPPLSRAVAEGILSLDFSQTDKERMRALTARARAGALTADEQAEVEAYGRVGSLLGILQSRARRALKPRGTNGKPKSL